MTAVRRRVRARPPKRAAAASPRAVPAPATAGAASARPRRMRRIGITCYSHFGGSGVVASELGLALARRGFEVHFIAHRLPFRLRNTLESDHVASLRGPRTWGAGSASWRASGTARGGARVRQADCRVSSGQGKVETMEAVQAWRG